LDCKKILLIHSLKLLWLINIREACVFLVVLIKKVKKKKKKKKAFHMLEKHTIQLICWKFIWEWVTRFIFSIYSSIWCPTHTPRWENIILKQKVTHTLTLKFILLCQWHWSLLRGTRSNTSKLSFIIYMPFDTNLALPESPFLGMHA
jgi:hypothetical protein